LCGVRNSVDITGGMPSAYGESESSEAIGDRRRADCLGQDALGPQKFSSLLRPVTFTDEDCDDGSEGAGDQRHAALGKQRA
jgi:hypothetical protein